MDLPEFKTPPHNSEAEQALLGACLLDKEALESALEFVRTEDFYQEGHRLIFSCLKDLLNQGVPCDLVTLSAELSKKNLMQRAGGAAYLASLAIAVPSTASAAYYARLVAEKSLVRSLIAAASRISDEGFKGARSGEELLELAEEAVFRVSERRLGKGFAEMRHLMSDVIHEVERIQKNDGVTGVPTFRDLDFLLSGLHNGDLIILAARPAVGKTSMALNIAQNAGTLHKRLVAVFSLEMPKEQLVLRMLCKQARVNQSKVRSGRADPRDFAKLAEALVHFTDSEIYIDDSATITVSEMRAKCRKLKMEKKRLDLVVVDYLQLISGGSRRAENRQQEISEISRGLKAMAKELDVPVLALSQLSRLAERGSEEPSLSHLRESGAIEQDADVVVFLHRKKEEKGEGATPPGLIEVIVAKHRNGPAGKIEMVFIPEYTSFENKAKDDRVPDWEELPEEY
ncbi:MAG: replicative DNA helicase [Clostridiales bacterium]|nr:replicative DNA helicase [Clostridiales bacterium]